MIPGFIEIDRQRFYGEVWPRIRSRLEALESNWEAARKGERPILIKWGYKDAAGEKIVVAITRADDDWEQHWISPDLALNAAPT
ncbi:hypothetical protein [Cupriavidus necator]